MYSFLKKAMIDGKTYQYGDDASHLPKHLINRFLLAGFITESKNIKPVVEPVKPVVEPVKPIVKKSENGWEVILDDITLGTFKTKKEATAFSEVM